MMNEQRVFIGQLCRIEAAEEGGPRFNLDITNEDHRAASNLMLMYYEHHKVTDDVKKYPVKKLGKMKRDQRPGVIGDLPLPFIPPCLPTTARLSGTDIILSQWIL